MESSPSQTTFQIVPPGQFLKSIVDAGLASAADLEAFLHALPADKRNDTKQLAQELMRQNLLTRFQATLLCQGKTRALTLGNYLLTDKLGQGGMGLVYKAVHRRMKRVVALKVLAPGFTKDKALVERFQREAEAAARLAHPNIVAAYDAAEEQGVHFLAMEFVPGQDLSSWVKDKGALSVADAVNCVLQAARGLHYAHQAGVIHRDIKPHNLLRTTDVAGKPLIKVLDMGLARLESAPGAAPAKDLTDSGSIMGSCDYIAPEQAVNTKRADQRADIYSLGCTLYYLLTASPMFGGETAMEKFLAHQNDPIPPLRATRPDVPEALEAIYLRMVAKKVEDRYQTMAEVVGELERVALPASAAPTETGVSARRATPAAPAGLEATTFGGGPPAASQSHTETSPSLSERTATLHGVIPASAARKPWLLVGAGAGVAACVALAFVLLGSSGSKQPPGDKNTQAKSKDKGEPVVPPPPRNSKAVKVFILAGQSNMGGPANIRTLDRLADDPATKALLARVKNKDGSWVTRDDVWIDAHINDNRRKRGNLTVRFGQTDFEFGPELLFGMVMGDHYENQVLLIKVTRGQLSLAEEGRPPSSGGDTGVYYRQLIGTVRSSLANIKSNFPAYQGQGYELAGFVWFQGWNDHLKAPLLGEYERNLVNLIKDVRKDLEAPELPVVIGELGISGANANPSIMTLRSIQAAAASRPEFKGTVALAKTASFWDTEADAIYKAKFLPVPGKWADKEAEEQFNRLGSTRDYLYLGSGKTFALIGNEFGETMKTLLPR